MDVTFTLARLAAKARRAGVDRDDLERLTVGEILTVIHDSDEERKTWDRNHDQRTAAMLAMMANIHRKKGTRAFQPADFMPAPEAEQETYEDAERIFHQMADLIGATVINRN